MQGTKEPHVEPSEEKLVEKLEAKKYAFLNEISDQVDENTKKAEELEILKTQKTWSELGLS